MRKNFRTRRPRKAPCTACRALVECYGAFYCELRGARGHGTGSTSPAPVALPVTNGRRQVNLKYAKVK